MHKQGEQKYIDVHGNERSANDAFHDWGGPLGTPPVVQVKLAAIFDVLTFDQRQRVLEKLGCKPVRQFFDEESGQTISLHRFYGFYDAGGLAGDSNGYLTREEAISAIRQEYDESSIGTSPEQLGDAAVCVLSGEEFVAQLQRIDEIAAYGRFV